MPLLTKPQSLSTFFGSNKSKQSYWLRATSDTQSQQMVGAFFKAMQQDLSNGGYIFVKKSRAADVFRQLTDLSVAYKAIHLHQITDIDDILDLEDPKHLWIVIEDDSLPYYELAARFKVIEVALRHKMAPPLSDRITLPTKDERITKRIKFLIFIEMDYPSVKGYAVIEAQSRFLQIISCRVSRDNAFDHQIHSVFGEPEHSPDELKARKMNTTRIYGSGLKYQAELKNELSNYGGDSRDLEVLNVESNLAVAFPLGGEMESVDLSY